MWRFYRFTKKKALHGKAFKIAKNANDGYQRHLASMVYIFFGTESATLAIKSATASHTGTGILILKTNNYPKNYTNLLLENLKIKVCSSLKGNI